MVGGSECGRAARRRASRGAGALPGLHAVAIGFWALAVLLLVALLAGTVTHWALYPANARSHASHPVKAHFYGAAPMAMLTVGAATLLVGADVVGRRLAADADWVLWITATVIGLVTATAVSYLTFPRHVVKPDSVFGGWLMPIVPPMVSASTGALLLPYAAAGQARLDLLLCGYVMFGVSLLASMVVITLIWYRLALHQAGEARMIPTLWIVLGPLGQSITAATLLGARAHLAVPATEAGILRTTGVVCGLPVLDSALLWAVIAAMITVRTARDHLPFSLTWWSSRFPVGMCVTGTIGPPWPPARPCSGSPPLCPSLRSSPPGSLSPFERQQEPLAATCSSRSPLNRMATPSGPGVAGSVCQPASTMRPAARKAVPLPLRHGSRP